MIIYYPQFSLHHVYISLWKVERMYLLSLGVIGLSNYEFSVILAGSCSLSPTLQTTYQGSERHYAR